MTHFKYKDPFCNPQLKKKFPPSILSTAPYIVQNHPEFLPKWTAVPIHPRKNELSDLVNDTRLPYPFTQAPTVTAPVKQPISVDPNNQSYKSLKGISKQMNYVMLARQKNKQPIFSQLAD